MWFCLFYFSVLFILKLHVEGSKMLQIRRHTVGFSRSNGRQLCYVWAALVKVMNNPILNLIAICDTSYDEILFHLLDSFAILVHYPNQPSFLCAICKPSVSAIIDRQYGSR